MRERGPSYPAGSYPYGRQSGRSSRPGFWGGGWGGSWASGSQAGPESGSARETAPKPAAEDKLKELIVSPVYQPDKVNPKLIEIP